ncbi:MAG: type II toxin-antitoxin system VapC family toxin [Candidatus Dadabacteria bacterium]|nr:type II toxin-antitoxin system VapC family toxin [Candidatus Dadabacteria bacterium]NIS09981.1 type II toxin-antitoxin system VapC family toxin [Candidatus Dadabacteria bacterium]NIY22956.1 PIN domain-containing protein [Candidatus Dadabacteria bacterium]
MTLCDVTIYICSFREDSPNHVYYNNWLRNLLTSNTAFAYTEIVLSSFLRIATHPRIFKEPSPLKSCLKFTDLIRSHPLGVSIMPGARHWIIFEQLCSESNAVGNKIPDLYLAALAIEGEVKFATSDNGFKNINGLDCVVLKP